MSDLRLLWLRPPKGKVSVRRERVAEHLEPRGFDVTLLDVTPKNLHSAAIDVIRGRYDVVIGNVRAGLYAGYPLARLTRTPFVADVSDSISDIDDLPTPLFRMLKRYEWWILGNAEEAVYIPSVHREATARGLEGRSVPNSVDFEQFADPDPDAVERAGKILRAEGLDTDSPIVIYIGVFSAGRNVETMLEAARERPEWQFLLVGEGELEDEVAAAAESTPNLFYPGAFEYELMPGFLAHASAALCLVDVERPLKMSEYGAAGLPVLAAPGKLQREFNDDEALFVDPTPKGIAEALAHLESNPDEAAEYAAALRADAKDHSWESAADTYEEAIRSVLGDR